MLFTIFPYYLFNRVFSDDAHVKFLKLANFVFYLKKSDIGEQIQSKAIRK